MEESFRNSLIIISAIVIGGIFVHGLWTIRKNKNPYKLKANPKDIETGENKQRGFDRSGFDRDGVSQIKVVEKKEHSSKNQEVEQTVQETQNHLSTAAVDKIEPSFSLSDEVLSEQNIVSMHNNDENSIEEKEKEKVELDELLLEPEEPSVYSDPVSKPKPVLVKEKSTTRKTIKKTVKANIKRDQIEINFGDTNAIDTNAIDTGDFENIEEPSLASEKIEIDPEVLAISVIVPQGQIISGAALLPSLLTLGMKYGEMDVFHRHEDNAGNGKVTFSLVNAMNPGTFDLDNMENFVTQGISLFMTLPNAGNAFEVFDQMLIAAKQLANEFNGQLLDDKRNVLTKQTEQHYVTKIREFERKSCIASL